MNLVSTTFWSAVATALRIGAGLVTAKVVALVGGASGIAVLGQFQNFVQMISGFSGTLFQQGVVKYVAEYRKTDPDKLKAYIGTVVRVAMVSALAVSLALVVLHRPLAAWLMDGASGYSGLFLVAGASVTVMVTNAIALALLNGFGRIRTLLSMGVATSVIVMATTLLLVHIFGLRGALYAVVVAPLVVTPISLLTLRPHAGLIASAWRYGIDRQELHKMAGFALMGLAGIVALPLALLGIRSELARELGWEVAGYWQATWQISSAYLTVITTGLTVYYLPRLSALQYADEIRQELRGYLSFILPVALLLSSCILLFRDLIIRLLYSEQLLPARDMIVWQVAGDMVRVLTWALGYLQVAKAMSTVFVFRELTFAALWYAGTLLAIPYWQGEAPVRMYFLMTLLNGAFVYWVVGRRLSRFAAAPAQEGPAV